MTREELIESLNELFNEDKIGYDTYSDILDSVVDLADAEYERGKADRDKEIAEHNVFFSNKPIEDIVLEARADEREKTIDECIEYFEVHANEVWQHVSARDFICDRLEMLKEQKNA